jgi:hypothetical protein
VDQDGLVRMDWMDWMGGSRDDEVMPEKSRSRKGGEDGLQAQDGWDGQT